jgi:fructose-1,6-bisphosphatase/inositol monophosphatase family enzyme
VSLVDRVSAVLAEVIAEEIQPRFRMLAASDIEEKTTEGDPDDVVTVVDRLVEARLESTLPALVPGSIVIGEEAVHADPRRLDALAGLQPVWVVDPIDGTKNFARGEETFGVMIALVRGGITRAAWIALPARGQIFVAEEGGGTYLDGARVRIPAPSEPLRGTLYSRYMPGTVAAAVERATLGEYVPVVGAGAAAIEYTALVQGQKEFVVYYRLLPWDHAPGALVLVEAGGCVRHLDGAEYLPRRQSAVTVLGSAPATCASVLGWLARQ